MQAAKLLPPAIRPSLALLLFVILVSALGDDGVSYAQYRYRGSRRSQPATTNQAPRPKPPPAEKPQKFKDLAIDTEFYYMADKDHKMFPWVKISATSARSVPTAAKPTATVATV